MHLKGGREMAITRITGQGLCAISILVVLLWACLIGEHVMVRNANLETQRTLNALRDLRMKRQIQPVSAPVKLRAPKPALG
jgi:hypothetical protein